MDRIYGVDDNSINNINSMLDQNLRPAVRWSDPVLVTGTNNQPVLVKHKLDAVPNIIHVEPQQSGGWWVTTSDRTQWLKSSVVFHAGGTGSFVVHVGRR